MRITRLAAALAVLALAVACSGGPGETTDPVTVGFSAWPGWFPWQVAEEAGIFDQVGVDVELRWFEGYLDSINAFAAGQLDANAQTLNDTLSSVSAGAEEVIVLVNDNSTGNDQIIVRDGIEEIGDLEGKRIGVEVGVVDHFLLLLGLQSAGLSPDDVQIVSLETGAAAAQFATGTGDLDAVAVFAPFTTQALELPGSKTLFSSADFPGSIPDHLVVEAELATDHPETVQKLVDAWFATLDYIEEHPDEAVEVMAERAGVSVEDYRGYDAGTTLFSLETTSGPSSPATTSPASTSPRPRSPTSWSAPGSSRPAQRYRASSTHASCKTTPPAGRHEHDRQRAGRGGAAPRPAATEARAYPAALDLVGYPGGGPGPAARGARGGVVVRPAAAVGRALRERRGRSPVPPGPVEVVRAFGRWVASGDLVPDVIASVRRVTYGFGLALLVSVPLGLAMGAFRGVQSLFEPMISVVRYMPATAFVPLLLIWFGLDEAPKVALIFLGTLFFNTLMTADTVWQVPQELIKVSYTLGASRAAAFWRVIFPHCLPGTIDAARVDLAAAWNLIVVAELFAANEGVGLRVIRAQKFIQTDLIVAVLVVIGLLGVATDVGLRLLRNRLSPWAR